tara:strand:- start:1860 stop:2099 length:240 start_codon:yes stop_codon:yes gene_type:complete
MIVEKLQMPYILASGHGMFHLACLLSSFVFFLVKVVNDEVTYDPFSDDGFKVMTIAHTICLFICALINVTKIFEATTKD